MKRKVSYTLVDYNKVVEMFHNETDRAAAVLAASFLECFLESYLRCFLKDGPITDALFEANGPLSTFSSTSNIAYAIGAIDEVIHKDLKFIRKIRNHFAHYPEEATFDKTPVQEFCKELSTSQLGQKQRDVFLFAVGLTIGQMHNLMLARTKSS